MIKKRNNKMNNSWKQYYNQYLSHIVKVDDENDRNNINQWLVMLLNVIKNDQNVINEIYQIENNIVSKLILITTSCLDQDILPVTIVTNVYNIYKIMLRKHESNNSNNALYTEQFVKLAITILNQLFSKNFTNDNIDTCKIAIISSINNSLISYQNISLQDEKHYVCTNNFTLIHALLNTMKYKASAKYLTILSNIIYRCTALNKQCFQILYDDIILIIVPTLASSLYLLKHAQQQQEDGIIPKDCVDLMLAVLRIVSLYGPSFLKNRNNNMDEQTMKLISSTGIILLNILSLKFDLFHTIYPLKLSVIRILIDVPETYLIFIIMKNGLKDILNMLNMESEKIMIDNIKDNNIVTNNFVPILLVLIRILKIKKFNNDAFNMVQTFIFPNNLPRDKDIATTNGKRNMEPIDAPNFTLRRYLINMLLEFSSSTNVIIPLGDLLYILCKQDGDELIKRCGLGYSAGILQRQGALGQFMKGVPSNFG